MQLAARSYLAAGVALVGASAIAVSPVAPSTPSVHVPVALTAAVDNPLTVFEPVATAAQTMFENIIERQTTNPAPIPRQLAENAVAAYQSFMSTPPAWLVAYALTNVVVSAQEFGPNLAALGETTSAAGTVLSESLGELAAGLPAGLQAAAAKIAAGDAGAALDGLVLDGMQPVINILIFAVSPEINAIGHVLNIPQPLIDATAETAMGLVIGLAAGTVGVGGDLYGQPRALLKQAIVGAQDLANAVTSGDPVKVVNAVQHGIADLAESAIFQIDTAIGMANYIEDTYANALKQLKPKPFTPPDITLPTATALTAPAPAAIEVSTLTEEKAETAPATNADNDSGAESTGTAADGAAATDGDEAGTGTVTKVSTKAPVKASPRAKVKADSPAKTVRDQVKSAVQKVTGGLKKDKAGTKNGTEKKAESSDSAKGSDTE